MKKLNRLFENKDLDIVNKYLLIIWIISFLFIPKINFNYWIGFGLGLILIYPLLNIIGMIFKIIITKINKK